MAELTLYLAPGASSMAPHIALQECGARFTLHPLSLARRETRQPAFLALNPEGKVPLLLVDGVALTEVAAILFYLARRYPAAALWPEDALQQAQVISWMSFLASTVHPARRQGADAARQAWALAERRLGGGDWAAGRYGIADIHLFRLFWRLRGSMPVEAAALPRLMAHHDRMMARPAVQRAISAEAAIGYELPA